MLTEKNSTINMILNKFLIINLYYKMKLKMHVIIQKSRKFKR